MRRIVAGLLIATGLALAAHGANDGRDEVEV